MSLRSRLNRLDSLVFKSLRQPGEDAETFLRRVAIRKLGSARDIYAVQEALRQHLKALDAERARR